MLQQINLYRGSNDKKIILPSRQIIGLNLLLIIILLFLSIFKFVDYYLDLKKLKKLQQTQANLNKGLVSVKKTVPTEQQKKDLTNNLLNLQQKKEYKQKMYNTLVELHYQQFSGLSGYLNAMALPETTNMWIDKFKFTNNAKKIHFEGVTLHNGSVLKYLEDLGKIPLFNKRNISNLEIFFDETTKQIKFIIDS